MTASALLQQLIALGVILEVGADQIRFSAPPGVMTPGRLNRVREHKAALLGLLSKDNTEDKAGPDLPLLAAIAEFDALIDRLCDNDRHSPAVKQEMRANRKRMSPERVLRELKIVSRRSSGKL
jgi:hypothetical protein